VVGFALPAVCRLLRSGSIDNCFFVVFRLGGPHLRLRLRALPGREAAIAEALRTDAQGFLDRTPSTKPIDPAKIAAGNAAILASDRHETDAPVHPDNTFLPAPFEPETARYGGPELLPASLDFFGVSSAVAWELLSRQGAVARASLLASAYRLLLRQALGFAASETELRTLLSYGLDRFPAAGPAIAAKGDAAFDARPETFQGLFRHELAAAATGHAAAEAGRPAASRLGAAARGLSLAVAAATAYQRQDIGISQLHMTANRLGLTNSEEAYLSRLLSRTAESLFPSATDPRTGLQAVFESAAEPAVQPPALPRLLAQALAGLAELAP
jgi:thiopeptide-type bacteriocin biosynthesis protein